jgi:hypothetical protein
MTTGKLISGKSAYFKELKAKIPAIATANQKAMVNLGALIAIREIFRRSRHDSFMFVE